MAAPPMTVAMPSIFNLQDDLFLHIFHLNTYMAETEYCEPSKKLTPSSPINTARYSSQVCRAWRQILLGSPMIWGSLIDINMVGKKSDTWAEEVMKRTGESYLSIYGWVGLTERSRAFFESILRDHWNRVRRLEVVLILDTWPEFHLFFARPAPNLEKFLVRKDTIRTGTDLRSSMPSGGDEDKTQSQNPIFADFAPSLRRFHCRVKQTLRSATWMAQLSSVTLSLPLYTTEVFSILCTTVRLESIFIENTSFNPEEDTKWSTQIRLPHLRRIHILGTISQSLVYLQHIVGHPDCALVLHTHNKEEEIIVPEFDRLLGIFAPYAARFFATHKPQTLSLIMGMIYFEVLSKASTDMVYFARPATMFRFAVTPTHLEPDFDYKLLVSIIFSTLVSAQVGGITVLKVYNKKYTSWIDAENSHYVSFITSLTSVHTLVITHDVIKSLNTIPDSVSSALVLPHLQTICFKDNSTQDLKSDFGSQLLLFLSRRKAAGVPVVTLDITTFWYGKPQYKYDWGFLDEIEGLRVVWKRTAKEMVYVCGSGEKDVLHWT